MKIRPDVFMYHLFTFNVSIASIIQEQYILAKYCNISLTESENLTEFEREAYVNMHIADLKRKSESMDI